MLHQRLGVAALREARTGQESSEPTGFDDHFPSAQLASLIGFLFRHLQAHALQRFLGILQLLAETVIEFRQKGLPLLLALLHGVQTGLHIGGKLHINDIVEPLHHQARDNLAQGRGRKALVLFDDILPILNGGHGGGVGGRTAHALFLHGLDQGRLGIPCGGLGKVLGLLIFDRKRLVSCC